MSVHQDIQNGIWNKFNTVNDFNTAIGNRLYFTQAPQSPTFPYAVAFLNYNPQDRDSENLFENLRLQIQIFQDPNITSPESVNSIADKAMNLFDNSEGTWTITNYELIRIDRDFNQPIPIEENIDRYQIDYLMDLQRI